MFQSNKLFSFSFSSIKGDVDTYLRKSDLGTYLRKSDLGTYLRESDLGTYLRESDLGTYLRERDLDLGHVKRAIEGVILGGDVDLFDASDLVMSLKVNLQKHGRVNVKLMHPHIRHLFQVPEVTLI